MGAPLLESVPAAPRSVPLTLALREKVGDALPHALAGAVAVGAALRECVGLWDTHAVGEPEAEAQGDARPEAEAKDEADAVGQREGEGAPVPLRGALGELPPLAEGEPLPPPPLPLGARDTEGEGVPLTDKEGDPLALGEPEDAGLADTERVTLSVAVVERLAATEFVGVALTEWDADTEGLRLGDTEEEGVLLPVAVAEPLAVALPLLLAVELAVDVRVNVELPVAVAVALELREEVEEAVAVAVKETEPVEDEVALLVAVVEFE